MESNVAAEEAMELFAKMYQVEGRFKADTKECCKVSIQHTIKILKSVDKLGHVSKVHFDFLEEVLNKIESL